MLGYFDTELGRVQISPTIVRRLILSELERNRTFSFHGHRRTEEVSRKLAEKCIRVNFIEGQVEVVLHLSVMYGARLIKEARELQGKITRLIQLQAGLHVRTVAINIEGVFEEEPTQPLLLEDEPISANTSN